MNLRKKSFIIFEIGGEVVVSNSLKIESCVWRKKNKNKKWMELHEHDDDELKPVCTWDIEEWVSRDRLLIPIPRKQPLTLGLGHCLVLYQSIHTWEWDRTNNTNVRILRAEYEINTQISQALSRDGRTFFLIFMPLHNFTF